MEWFGEGQSILHESAGKGQSILHESGGAEYSARVTAWAGSRVLQMKRPMYRFVSVFVLS